MGSRSLFPGKLVTHDRACWPKASWNVINVLTQGQVFPVHQDSVASLELPAVFWGHSSDDALLPPQLVSQLEQDLEWQ